MNETDFDRRETAGPQRRVKPVCMPPPERRGQSPTVDS
jgi:hypothetical protein